MRHFPNSNKGGFNPQQQAKKIFDELELSWNRITNPNSKKNNDPLLFQKKIIEKLAAFDGAQRVLILMELKELLGNTDPRSENIANGIIKLEFQHINPDEPGVLEIRFAGEVYAYFKVGDLRAASDRFLHEFAETLLGESEIYAKSYYCELDLNLAANNKETKSPVSYQTRRNEKSFYLEIQTNQLRSPLLVAGSLQPALAKPAEETSLEIIINQLLVGYLTCMQDLKLDGVMGTHRQTIVDQELVLDPKKHRTKLHIPFIEEHLHSRLPAKTWVKIVEEFISKFSNFEKEKACQLCEDFQFSCARFADESKHKAIKLIPDQRQNRKFSSIEFQPLRLFAEEQVVFLNKRFDDLRLICENFIERFKDNNETITLIDFLIEIEPDWVCEFLIYELCRTAAENERASDFFDIRCFKFSENPAPSKYSVDYRIAQGPTPCEQAGFAALPTLRPEKASEFLEFVEKTIGLSCLLDTLSRLRQNNTLNRNSRDFLASLAPDNTLAFQHSAITDLMKSCKQDNLNDLSALLKSTWAYFSYFENTLNKAITYQPKEKSLSPFNLLQNKNESPAKAQLTVRLSPTNLPEPE